MTEMFFARPQCNHDHSGILHKNEKGCAQFHVLACVLAAWLFKERYTILYNRPQ